MDDILQYPGTADITANVDFLSLKQIASKKGMKYLKSFFVAF